MVLMLCSALPASWLAVPAACPRCRHRVGNHLWCQLLPWDPTRLIPGDPLVQQNAMADSVAPYGSGEPSVTWGSARSSLLKWMQWLSSKEFLSTSLPSTLPFLIMLQHHQFQAHAKCPAFWEENKSSKASGGVQNNKKGQSDFRKKDM